MSVAKVIEFAKFLTSYDMTNEMKHFTLNQFFSLCNMIANKHIKTSTDLLEYSKNAMKYDDIVYVSPISGNDLLTISDFVSAMIYVNSQSRTKEERWSLSNLPNENSKNLAKELLALMKKQKVSLEWMG